VLINFHFFVAGTLEAFGWLLLVLNFFKAGGVFVFVIQGGFITADLYFDIRADFI